MRKLRAARALLLGSVFGFSALYVATSHAQGAAPAGDTAAAQASDTDQAGQLQEIVVTANRRAEAINRVPISIIANTQEQLDQEGVKSLADLASLTPSLQVSAQTGGNATFTIRDVQSTTGAPTTGVYLDDMPLGKRQTNGIEQSEGTPSPPLFDLDRVEILRGPQGTLYGASSEGGTIRFITPTPGLTDFTGLSRAEWGWTQTGAPSYELGQALGGPIIPGKLGFRASLWYRTDGGFINIADPNPQKAIDGDSVAFTDANYTQTEVARIALLFKATDQLQVNLSSYWSSVYVNNGGGENSGSYTEPTIATGGIAGQITSGNGVFSTPVRCFTGTSTAAAACTAPGAFMRPAQTYGPYPFLANDKDSLATGAVALSPSSTDLWASSLTFDYGFPWADAKLISGYEEDINHQLGYDTSSISAAQPISLWSPALEWAPTHGTKISHQVTEELRFTSMGQGPLQWIAGGYYSDSDLFTTYTAYSPLEAIAEDMWGITAATRYGFPVSSGVVNNAPAGQMNSDPAIESFRIQEETEKQAAAYANLTYAVWRGLQAIGGIRYTHNTVSLYQLVWGPLAGFPVDVPATGVGITNGTVVDKVVSPKGGLQYQFTPNDMVYATATKGFRAGGVNVPPLIAVNPIAFAAYGITSASQIPASYKADSIWSYEVGAKVRPLPNFQINADVFRVVWSNLQLSNTAVAGTAQAWITNGGAAVSQGIDLDTEWKFHGLLLTAAGTYDRATYSETALGPKPLSGPAAPIVLSGQEFSGLPLLSATASAQYDFSSPVSPDTYIRADWHYTGPYNGNNGPGTAGFAPVSYINPAVTLVNMRFGLLTGGEGKTNYDLNLFVNNVFDTAIISQSGGPSACSVATGAACTSYASFSPFFTATKERPRTIGIQVNRRF